MINLCFQNRFLTSLSYIYMSIINLLYPIPNTLRGIAHSTTKKTRRTCRDHFVYTPSLWETTLQCSLIPHWLGAYIKWSLIIYQILNLQKIPYTLSSQASYRESTVSIFKKFDPIMTGLDCSSRSQGRPWLSMRETYIFEMVHSQGQPHGNPV